jgi:hypothetical protein
MLYPVPAGILKACGKTALSLLFGNVFCKDTQFLQIAEIYLQFCGYKANAETISKQRILKPKRFQSKGHFVRNSATTEVGGEVEVRT